MHPAADIIANNQASFAYVIPEMVIIAGILIHFLVNVFSQRGPRRRQLHTGIALGTVGLAVALLFQTAGWEATTLFNGLLVHDSFAWFFRLFALVSTGIVIAMVPGYDEIPTARVGEFYALMLTITLGLLLLPASVDLLMIVLSLELISLISYVLTGYRKGVRQSAEGALKYVIYGGVATGTMLYGFSLLYGLSGGTTLTAIHDGLSTAVDQVYLQSAIGDPTAIKLTLAVAVVFVLVGFGYKIAAVPFHLWTPDAYEGAPTPFTAFLSVGPKAAGLALMIRFFFGIFTEYDPSAWADGVIVLTSDLPWPYILGILSIATMTVGNLTALTQTNIKRMLAFSSIAHAGYMLMGLAAVSTAGLQAVLIYTIVYLFMNLGAFTIVTAVTQKLGSEDIEEFRGLARRGGRAGFYAVAMAIFLFSLTGLPPFAGFIGKFYLFYAVILQGGSFMWVLVIIGGLNGAVSLYYYARVVKLMFLDEPYDTSEVPLGGTAFGLSLAMVIPTVVFGLYWAPLADAAKNALDAPPLASSMTVANVDAPAENEKLTQR